MIKTRKLLSAFVALGLSVGMVACAGDDGKTGPAGNANVKATTQTIKDSDWVSKSSQSVDYELEVSVPSINQNVLDNGAVMVYLKPDTVNNFFEGENWTALPQMVIRYVGGSTAVGVFYDFTYEVGKIKLTNKAGYNFQNYSPGAFSFKAVVIPSSAIKSGVNLENYEEVKAVYGIQEFDLEL